MDPRLMDISMLLCKVEVKETFISEGAKIPDSPPSHLKVRTRSPWHILKKLKTLFREKYCIKKTVGWGVPRAR